MSLASVARILFLLAKNNWMGGGGETCWSWAWSTFRLLLFHWGRHSCIQSLNFAAAVVHVIFITAVVVATKWPTNIRRNIEITILTKKFVKSIYPWIFIRIRYTLKKSIWTSKIQRSVKSKKWNASAGLLFSYGKFLHGFQDSGYPDRF